MKVEVVQDDGENFLQDQETEESLEDSDNRDSLRLEDDMLLETLSEAKREVEEDSAIGGQIDAVKKRPLGFLSFHHGSKVQPNYEPTLKKAMILEKTTSKLADKLG